MGVFAVIGVLLIIFGLASRSGRLAVLGLIVMGIGIAGSQNGY